MNLFIKPEICLIIVFIIIFALFPVSKSSPNTENLNIVILVTFIVMASWILYKNFNEEDEDEEK